MPFPRWLRDLTVAGLSVLAVGAGSYLMRSNAGNVATSQMRFIDPSAHQYKVPSDTADVMDQFEERVAKSVVCIRADSEYTYPQNSGLTGKTTTIFNTRRTHGTGFLIAEIQENNGDLEYRILTNNHVATDAEIHIVELDQTYLLERMRLHIVDDGADQQATNDIELKVVATNPNLDLAILETVGNKRKFPIANIVFGMPKRIDQNDLLITAGYPFANNKQTIQGKLSSTDYMDLDVLPYPTNVYSVDLRFDGGQSGSPVGVPLIDEHHQLQFYLAGLIYASVPKSDTTRLITPINEEAIHFIMQQQSTESKRPSLRTPITTADWDKLRRIPNGLKAIYAANENTYHLIGTKNKPILRRFKQIDGITMDDAWIDIALSIDGGKVALRHVTATSDSISAPIPLPEERIAYYGPVFQALLNGFRHQQAYRTAVQKQNATSEETRMRKYLARIVNEDTEILKVDLQAFDYDLKSTDTLPESLRQLTVASTPSHNM